jgi:uncharacterized protein
MYEFKEYVDKSCKGCKHIKYCRGGCPYNAIAPTEGEIRGVDPHCIAYKRIFNEINDRFNKELFGSSGMEIFGLGPKSANTMNVKPGIMALMRKIASK